MSLMAMRAGVVALACSLAACSSGTPTSTPSAFAQRFADGAPCPVATANELPSGSGCVTSVRADLDGDGRADRFVVYARLADGRPVSWWAETLRGDAGRPTKPVRLPTGPSVGGNAGIYPRVAGAAQANGVPGQEVFVQLSADLYHGAARPIDAIYDVRGSQVRPFTSAGRLFTFFTSGISRFGDGARCETAGGRHVLVLTHVEILPHGWLWSENPYRWNGLELAPEEGRQGRLPDIPISDPLVYRNYQLICGGLKMSQVTDSYPKP
jgi:hypothetical protein